MVGTGRALEFLARSNLKLSGTRIRFRPGGLASYIAPLRDFQKLNLRYKPLDDLGDSFDGPRVVEIEAYESTVNGCFSFKLEEGKESYRYVLHGSIDSIPKPVGRDRLRWQEVDLEIILRRFEESRLG